MDTEAVQLHGNTYSGQMPIYSNLKYFSHVTKHINVEMGVISLQDLYSNSFKESVYNKKASPFQYQRLWDAQTHNSQDDLNVANAQNMT